MFEDMLPFYLKTGLFGLLTGFTIGFALKKISKVAVFILGLILIVVQIMVYNGYIQVDWLQVQDITQGYIGDNDISGDKVKGILMINLPFTATALIGFLFGFKKG